MELKDIKLGQQVRIKAAHLHIPVYTLAGVELTARGLILVLEREFKGEMIRRQESAEDCQKA